ncbi:MAG TPA: DUF3828 domain-containing protein [Edaphobacter sp.]|nr:DUF3828 domain-containing protein [Edaphobacter sp.]
MTKRFVRLISIGFLFLALGGAKLLVADPAPAAKPGVVAAEFYKWYLHELEQNHDPISKNERSLSPYVSASLLRELKRMMQSPNGIGADYFLQAQDYLDDWPTHISVGDTKIQSGIATTVVTLGESPANPYRLAVTLQQEGGSWKIRRVKRLPRVVKSGQ